jgi:simple sugar transport system substrate-binding protein
VSIHLPNWQSGGYRSKGGSVKSGNVWIRIGIFVASLTVLGALIYQAVHMGKPTESQVAESENNSIENSNHWIALVIEFTNAEHSKQYLEGAREEAKRLGVRLEILDAKSNRKKMAHMIDDAILRNADGIMISHGSPEALTASVKRSLNQSIPVVAFDCEIPLPEVTKIDQDDKRIAEMSLKRILKNTGGKGNLVLIWVGGYAPMDKRMNVYRRFMSEHPRLKEVVRFGEATTDTAMYTQINMKSVLDSHPVGTINVVWATWDEFAKGAAQAIKDAGRTEIKLYGIDISNEDLKYLQDPNSPWIETVAVDPRSIAKVQLRLLVRAVKGEKIPEHYALTPRLVTKTMLPKDAQVTMDNLHKYVPDWGGTEEFDVNQ